ncbi:membrane protein [Fulvitalea axinellae]|uniref:Membrane protein n=1 Tax=Fulvitalea axinellae TaxID=1182444 RepID=A0AAU9CW86_9BACT|nr:membrane protein [Fulvitalea axinellae]
MNLVSCLKGRTTLIALFLFGFSVLANAQEAQEPDKISEEKGAELSFIHRCMALADRMASLPDKLAYENENIKITPIPLLAYSPSTGFKYGVYSVAVLGHKDSETATVVTPRFSFSTKQQMGAKVGLDLFMGDSYVLNSELVAEKYPDEFYGIGNEAFDDPLDFTKEWVVLNADVLRRLKGDTWAGLSSHLLATKISEIQNVEDGSVDNPLFKNGRASFIGIGPVFRIDKRENRYAPKSGYFLETKGLLYKRFDKDVNPFGIVKLDYRHYFSWGNGNNVMAFQMLGEGLVNAENTPFYLYPKIGGEDRLRGTGHENRYADERFMFVRSEYRKHLFSRFGMVAFAGIGHHGAGSEWDSENFRHTVGLGGRFYLSEKERINLRIDIGTDLKGEKAIYFSLKEAF